MYLFRKTSDFLTVPVVLIIKAYKLLLSPIVHIIAGPGMGCRHQPVCSDYALEAVHVHGFFGGMRLALGRICRCGPFGSSGYDPVPLNRQERRYL